VSQLRLDMKQRPPRPEYESREGFLEAERSILRRCAQDGSWPELVLVRLWKRVFRRGVGLVRLEASARIADFSGFTAEGSGLDDEALPSEIVARAHSCP